jgi:hypothetical protein
MKTATNTVLVLSILLLPLTGCQAGPERRDFLSTQEAVAAEATRAAESNQQATIEAVVAATQTASAAVSPTPTIQSPPTPTAAPATPTPSSQEYATLTEEELTALIDRAVTEAATATEGAATEAETATADDALTPEEMAAIEESLLPAQEAIALAEELIYVYADLYGELAIETLTVLREVEQLLTETTELLVALTAIVEDVDRLLNQGAEVPQESIEQLLALIQTADLNAAEIQSQIENWTTALPAEWQARVAAALEVPPTEIPASRRDAIESATTYVEQVRASLADGRISQQELAAIAQAGANAVAGLQSQGGPQLQNLATTLDQITAAIAQGRLPDVQGLLAALESSLPALPSAP